MDKASLDLHLFCSSVGFSQESRGGDRVLGLDVDLKGMGFATMGKSETEHKNAFCPLYEGTCSG